jgi:hypothetical protein
MGNRQSILYGNDAEQFMFKEKSKQNRISYFDSQLQLYSLYNENDDKHNSLTYNHTMDCQEHVEIIDITQIEEELAKIK